MLSLVQVATRAGRFTIILARRPRLSDHGARTRPAQSPDDGTRQLLAASWLSSAGLGHIWSVPVILLIARPIGGVNGLLDRLRWSSP